MTTPLPLFELVEDLSMADVAFRAYGSSPGELFRSASLAVLSVLLENPLCVAASESVPLSLRNAHLDLLLFDFLNELIYRKDVDAVLLYATHAVVECAGSEWTLDARLTGERIDRGKHVFAVDIKAATMHRLSVENNNGLWVATVVLDV